MRHLIHLTDFSASDIAEIFRLADEIADAKHADALRGRSVVLFFPPTSLLTRTTFERAVYLLGGQPILFPSDTLDRSHKGGTVRDAIGYLNNWSSAIAARYHDVGWFNSAINYAEVPIINAMTDDSHPCEILSDLYALSKLRGDWRSASYLFVGVNGNIGNTWRDAAQTLGLNLTQCCPVGYEIDGAAVERDVRAAIADADIVLTDPLPRNAVSDFATYRITAELMQTAKSGALLNPCPQFNRGEEVSEDAIDSEYFVGYSFKKHLTEVQGAILLYCIE
jgi:ornithine carbamoyltransferase